MRLFLLFLFFFTLAFSEELDDFYGYYKSKDFGQSCEIGGRIFYDYRFDENFVQAYGFACLAVDNIGMIANVPRYLKKTKESRQNASYFSLIMTQKKLIYQAIIDELDLKGLSFPKTDHVLSKVFEKLSSGDYTKEGTTYILSFQNGYVIKVDKIFDGEIYKVIINEYKNNSVIKKHLYW